MSQLEVKTIKRSESQTPHAPHDNHLNSQCFDTTSLAKSQRDCPAVQQRTTGFTSEDPQQLYRLAVCRSYNPTYYIRTNSWLEVRFEVVTYVGCTAFNEDCSTSAIDVVARAALMDNVANLHADDIGKKTFACHAQHHDSDASRICIVADAPEKSILPSRRRPAQLKIHLQVCFPTEAGRTSSISEVLATIIVLQTWLTQSKLGSWGALT